MVGFCAAVVAALAVGDLFVPEAQVQSDGEDGDDDKHQAFTRAQVRMRTDVAFLRDPNGGGPAARRADCFEPA